MRGKTPFYVTVLVKWTTSDFRRTTLDSRLRGNDESKKCRLNSWPLSNQGCVDAMKSFHLLIRQ